MRTVFADSNYFIALLNKCDDLHTSAQRMSLQVQKLNILTTNLVLAELYRYFARSGAQLRQTTDSFVQMLQTDERTEIHFISRIQFDAARHLYVSRPDKSWDLVDCASFVIMRERQISEALTYDEHFVQAGFRALLRDDA